MPPANEAGYEPGRSTISPSVTVSERQAAGRRDSERPAPSSRAIRARARPGMPTILERHPGFAEAHFRLARLLERQGRVTEAGAHYLAALDHDGLPIRCQAPFRAVYRAGRDTAPSLHPDRWTARAGQISPNGLIGDHVIHDTHHPTLRGYVALAGAVLRELERGQTSSAIDGRINCRSIPAACAAHFGMNADRWATTCERISEHYKRVAGYRYDPTERLEKSRRYAEAARRIRAAARPSISACPALVATQLEEPSRAADYRDSLPIRCRACQARAFTPGTNAAGSFGDLFHLPVLQVDHRAAAQEVDHGHELIPFGSADHLADHAGQRAGQ